MSERAPVPMTATQWLWATLALVGFVSVGAASLGVNGLGAFLGGALGTAAARTVSFDLLGLGVAATAFAVIESRRLGMRRPWLWVPLAVVLPGAFLIPTFFLLRERALLRAGELSPEKTAARR
jgi:hypothetical protein